MDALVHKYLLEQDEVLIDRLAVELLKMKKKPAEQRAVCTKNFFKERENFIVDRTKRKRLLYIALEKLKPRRSSQESPELKDMIGQLQNMIGSSWYTALEPEFSKPYFTQLCTFIDQERMNKPVYPPPNQVFSWTNFFPIELTKVVIIAQDPYHGPNQAHGLCFSVPVGVKPPPSLQNIYKVLVKDIPGFIIPSHGNLTGWAEQGVLLLNSILTVQASQANSHAGWGWETFTDAVIDWIDKNTTGVVFMLWGEYAQKKCDNIDLKKHLVLKTSHPSQQSAFKGLMVSTHFSQCNTYLLEHGKTPIINWNHLPPPTY